MLFLLLTACGVTVRPSCETVASTPLAHDEAALGVVPDDVAAFAQDLSAPTYAGTYEDGTPVDVAMAFEVDPGSARLVEQQETSIETRNGQLFGRSVLLIAVSCDDYVAMDGTLAVTTPDGAVDVDEPVSVDVSADLAQLHAGFRVPAAEMEGLPEIDGDPDEAFGDLQAEPDLGLGEGRLGWEASTDTESWARYLLTWGAVQDG